MTLEKAAVEAVARTGGIIMRELHFEGFIDNEGYTNGVVLKRTVMEGKEFKDKCVSVLKEIQSIAAELGVVEETHNDLGEWKSIIPNCSVIAYFTDKECTLEEAMMALDKFLYGGDMNLNVEARGYSEESIESLDVTDMTIGGHNIYNEIDSHFGEYCHLIIQLHDENKNESLQGMNVFDNRFSWEWWQYK